MRLVVTGSNGQVATALRACADQHSDIDVICLARPDFDLAEPARLSEKIAELAPDIVINAAAWTAVDLAESEADQAYAVNAAGAEAVARASAKLDIPILQISTDYVFAGDKLTPYIETDPTDPQSVYGASKLDGELRVAAHNPKHVILRTSWVYSQTGQNFLKTMLRVAVSRDALNVVADQFGAPTHADEIAQAVLAVSKRLVSGPLTPDLFGVFHMSCAGRTSWHGFAEAIFAASADLDGPRANVSPIPTEAYPTPAKRPANSCLSSEKLSRIYDVRLANWQAPIARTVEAVLAQAKAPA